jgi:hypothetical protein
MNKFSIRKTLGAVALILVSACGHGADVRVTFPWEKSWPVVSPATAGTFGFKVHNDGKSEAEVFVSAVFTTPSGTHMRVQKQVRLKAGSAESVPFPLTDLELGAWSLSYEIKGSEKEPAGEKHSLRFAYMLPAGPSSHKPEFLFGIVSHSERLPMEERHREIEAAAFAGCKVLRAGPEWQDIQPAADQWKWEVMDDMVGFGEQQGIEFDALLAYCPRWAAPVEKQTSADWLNWSRAAPDLDAWRRFIAAYTSRYKGRIRLWEAWNEPDLDGFWRGTTDEYIDLVKATVEEVKKVDPKGLVMSGGFATLREHGGRARNPDLQERTMRSVGSLLDLHAVHEHGQFPQLAQVVDGAYAALRKSLPPPVPPLFFNETAFPSTGNAHDQQAEVLIKKASFVRSRGAVGYLWYDLRNDGISETDPEHHFGLLTNELEPKPAYVAFSNFARLIAPRKFLEQLPMGDGRWFLVFGDDREKLMVFWNDDAGSQNEQVLLRLPGATAAKRIDINGNEVPLTLVDGTVVVTAGKRPEFILTQGGTGIEPAGRLAGATRSFFGAPGEEVALECAFTNPTNKEITVQVEWHPERGIDLAKAPAATLRLGPNSKGTASAVVRLPGGEDYKFGSSGNVRVFYEFAGAPYKGRLILPVHYGTIQARAGGTMDRAPDAVLNSREQLTSFIEADPHFVPYRWKNPEDLSAKLWFDATPTDLLLKVEVADNEHYQTEAGTDIWRGDSVQCAIGIPGQQDSWKIGFAEGPAGEPVAQVWNKPAAAETLPMKVTVEKRGAGRIYSVALGRRELGLTDQVMKDGFRFNIAVNDNDGKVRAHALQLAPGIVENKSMDAAPYVRFKEMPGATSK